MLFKMGGDSIERRLENLVIASAGSFAAKAGEEGASLRGVSEKPMHIAAAHPAIGRCRAIAASIGEMQQRPCAIRPETAADMHFVTGEGNPVLRSLSLHRRQHFATEKFRLDIEQAEPLRLAGRTFNACGIANDLAEHLITAAKAEHMAAAPQMRKKIDVPALAPESLKTGDRCFRAGQNDKRRPGGQGLAAPYHHKPDLALQLERIEIVE